MPPDVRALALDHLAPMRNLPFILVTDACGRWLGGSTGSTSALAVQTMLEEAVRACSGEVPKRPSNGPRERVNPLWLLHNFLDCLLGGVPVRGVRIALGESNECRHSHFGRNT